MNRPTSLYLDLVRFSSALVVVVSHLSLPELTGGPFAWMASLGVQAVDVFFVLSGFVIAYVCANSEIQPKAYFIGRAARIYSVLVPTLILIIIADHIGMSRDPAIYHLVYWPQTLNALLSSVLLLGEQWNSHRAFGSDGPLWSLNFEGWYYVAFGAFVFAERRWRWPALAAVLIFIGPKVALLFPLWLMGVATFRASRDLHIPRKLGWALFVAPILLAIAYQFLGVRPLQAFAPLSDNAARLLSPLQDYLIGGLFCANLIGFISLSKVFAPALEGCSKAIRWAAGRTFSIYLAHVPLLYLLASFSPLPPASIWQFMALLIAVLVLCCLFAEISERRKAIWTRLFSQLWDFTVPPVLRSANARQPMG